MDDIGAFYAMGWDAALERLYGVYRGKNNKSAHCNPAESVAHIPEK